MNKVFVVTVASLILLVGCTQTLRYPTIGARSFRVHPTNWAGETMRACCLPAVQAATGKKVYVCKHETMPECSRLTHESR